MFVKIAPTCITESDVRFVLGVDRLERAALLRAVAHYGLKGTPGQIGAELPPDAAWLAPAIRDKVLTHGQLVEMGAALCVAGEHSQDPARRELYAGLHTVVSAVLHPELITAPAQ